MKSLLYKDRISNFLEFLKSHSLEFLVDEKEINEQMQNRYFPIIEMEHATRFNMLLIQAMLDKNYRAIIQNYLARE